MGHNLNIGCKSFKLVANEIGFQRFHENFNRHIHQVDTLTNYTQQIKFYLKFHSRTVAADTPGLLKQ